MGHTASMQQTRGPTNAGSTGPGQCSNDASMRFALAGLGCSCEGRKTALRGEPRERATSTSVPHAWCGGAGLLANKSNSASFFWIVSEKLPAKSRTPV